MIALIRKTGFKNCVLVIPRPSAISNIPKTMIFIDLIDKTTEMVKYLQSRLSKHIRMIKQSDMIIRVFFANLTAESQMRLL